MGVIGDVFKNAIGAALQEYGAGVVLLILGIVALFIMHERLWQARLKDKDKEIARISAQRRRLEEVILKRRLGTGLDEEGEP